MRASALAVIIALAAHLPRPPRLPPLFEELLKKNRRRSILRKLNFLRQKDDVGAGDQGLELRGWSGFSGQGCRLGGSMLC